MENFQAISGKSGDDLMGGLGSGRTCGGGRPTRELSEERQETIARAILDYASHDEDVYHLTGDERIEVRAGWPRSSGARSQATNKSRLCTNASGYEDLQEHSRSAADNVTASIRHTIARLTEMPLLGKPTDEPNVRVIIEPVYRYRVFYVVESEYVVVIRIMHSRQK